VQCLQELPYLRIAVTALKDQQLDAILSAETFRLKIYPRTVFHEGEMEARRRILPAR